MGLVAPGRLGVAAESGQAGDQADVGMGVEKGRLALQAPGMADVVGVHAGDGVAPGGGQPGRQGRHDAAVGPVEDAQAGVAPGVGLKHRLGRPAVVGTVVYGHDLEIAKRLAKQAVQGGRQAGGGVAHRQEHGNHPSPPPAGGARERGGTKAGRAHGLSGHVPAGPGRVAGAGGKAARRINQARAFMTAAKSASPRPVSTSLSYNAESTVRVGVTAPAAPAASLAKRRSLAMCLAGNWAG